MRGEFVDVGPVRLYYYAAGTRGAGDPIVLIHGFGTSAHLWRHIVPRIPPGHRSISVDLAAHGRSDVTDGMPYDPPGHARMLSQLLDELQVSRATVVAHGMGCEIAATLASDSDRVRALLLLSPAGTGQRVPATPPPRSAARLALDLPWGTPAIAAFRRYLVHGYASRAIATRSLDRHLQWFRARHRRTALAAQLTTLRARSSPIALDQPLEILVGARDPFVSARRVDTRFLAPGRGTLTTLGGERHFLPEEAPELVSRVLARLL